MASNKKPPAEIRNEPPPYAPVELGIGQRIKKHRETLGLNFEQLAALTKLWDDDGKGPGIASVTLRRYEREDDSATLPGLRELRILSNAFGVTADSLLFGDTPPYEAEERRQWEAFKSVVTWIATAEKLPGVTGPDPMQTFIRDQRLQAARLHTKRKDAD